MNFLTFLNASDVQLDYSSYKVHLATHSTDSPLNAFLAGKFKEWQELQTKRNFPCKHILSLIQYKRNYWVFAGVYEVIGDPIKVENTILYKYNTRLLPNQENLIGKVIVYHERKGRPSYLVGAKNDLRFSLGYILENQLTIRDFPGYYNINISHVELQTIISQQLNSWVVALRHMKGVYLITDCATGKLYVGSAYGDQGILSRWSQYVLDGHGGNQRLKVKVATNNDYAGNYQYSILEIADPHARDEYVIERENHWKSVLKSREFGYNEN